MNVLEKSIIVAAHPDDENLWFSSVLSKVDSIVLCFLPVVSRPAWTEGRRKSLAAYPLENITCLGLEESEVFWGADWNRPVKTEYGLEITENELPDSVYRNNFHLLVNRLREALRGYENVFTHNPWGEYGHVEHVQVYRAVKSLQPELQFRLWYTGYVSNKSVSLMAREYSTMGQNLGMMKTDKALAESIAGLYKKNECWSWYEDYEWCDHETFVLDIDDVEQKGQKGNVLSLNMIDVGVEPVMKHKTRLQSLSLRIKRKMRRLFDPKARAD
jgi:LmbE family N-acetylglucosaminyl deacetylase